MFPAGRAGVGLVFLRLSAATSLWVGTNGELGPILHERAALVCWALALPLGMGAATVLCAMVCFLTDMALLLTVVGLQVRCVAVAALLCASLALLGPGAYSVDARLFGRRVVFFQDCSNKHE
jgi:hypothetical protein